MLDVRWWRLDVFLLLLLFTTARPSSAIELWVAPGGSDTNAATREQPLATLDMALRKARELRRLNHPSISNGIHIILRGGRYSLDTAILVRSEDSGTESSPTVIRAADGERPVLSSGVKVGNWQRAPRRAPGLPSAARGHVWVAPSPVIGGRATEFRQLWVNNQKAVRARNPNGKAMNRLLAWDRRNEEAWIPSPTLAGVRMPGRLEMVFHQQWEIAICRVKSIEVEGARARLKFHSPEGRIQFEHPWPQPVMSTNGNAPFCLVNAIEFLDEPGEWWQDPQNGQIYYWPRPGENLDTADVIVPHLETLVEVRGTVDRPVENIHFRGIGFAHTSWMRPSRAGHGPLQAGMFLLDAYRLNPKGTDYHSPGLDNQAWIGRPPAAVTVRGARRLRFEGCRFEHTGFSGLDLVMATQDNVVEGCLFRDIGGNGIQLGTFSDPGVETHRPYNPSDDRELVMRERIANNLITDCANEDWGCVGILAGFVRDVTIAHNEISNTSYTGISVGWGWNKGTNCMRDNRIVANHIHHVATRMCDTAGIYTLSVQPGTIISSNAVHSITMNPYVFNPEHWFYLYLDEGSSFITVKDNWCPEERFLRNANGPGNVWENNGPAVSRAIRESAGLQPDFRHLLREIDH